MAEFVYNLKPIQSVLRWRRIYRCKSVLDKVSCHSGMSILDVGCGCDVRSFEAYVPPDFNIVGIDLFEPERVKINHPRFRYYWQDATDMSMFGDKAFDLAVSIGMIEHICNRTVLNGMASEIERVAKQWIIIVPWRYGFIEPHFKFPFFPLLPRAIQIGVSKRLNLHNLAEKIRGDSSYILNHYQWLSTKEWVDIFKADATYILPPLFDVLAIVKRNLDAKQGQACTNLPKN